VNQLLIAPHAGSSGMSQSFSLAFRLDKRAGDGVLERSQLTANRIHLHDKRAGVSFLWVMTLASSHGYMLLPLPWLYRSSDIRIGHQTVSLRAT